MGLSSFLRAQGRRRHFRVLVGVALTALILIVYAVRPLGFIREPLMFVFVRYPALFWVPLVLTLLAAGVHVAVKMIFGDRYVAQSSHLRPSHLRRSRFEGTVITAAIAAVTGLIAAMVMAPLLTGQAIYDNSDYADLDPGGVTGADVRVKPYEVAANQIDASLNSSIDQATNLRIVKVDGELRWTSVRDPDGLVRVFTRKTSGVISSDARSSEPNVVQSGPTHDAAFALGPGMQVTDNLSWAIHKACFTCDVAEVVALPTAQGPVLVAPVITFEGGLLVKRPVYAGVFVATPDGELRRLNPEQAAADRLVASAGRLYPEQLARRVNDSYQYKLGIINRLFTHREQFEVGDSDAANSQPYLQDIDGLGPQWVTALKPRGQSFTTAAVIFTDAITGRNRIWETGRGRALIGNQRALEIVRGEPGLDVVFADETAVDAGGKFRAIEPRPVFVQGRLQFLVSVVPNAANRVALSVIVDSQSQQVTASFDADGAGDRALIAYLGGRGLDPEARLDGGVGDDPDTDPGAEVSDDGDTDPGDDAEADDAEADDVPLPLGDGAQDTLRRLLAQNRSEQRDADGRLEDLRAQERDLRRLLDSAD